MLTRITSNRMASELCQIDHRGQVVPRDKQTLFCVEIALTCQAPDSSIDLGLLASTEVDLERLADIPKDKRLNAVAYATAKKVSDDLSRARIWELYRLREIYIPTDNVIQADNQEGFVADVDLTSDLATAFQDATKRHSEVNAAFERAKKFLTRNMRSIFLVRGQARVA